MQSSNFRDSKVEDDGAPWEFQGVARCFSEIYWNRAAPMYIARTQDMYTLRISALIWLGN